MIGSPAEFAAALLGPGSTKATIKGVKYQFDMELQGTDQHNDRHWSVHYYIVHEDMNGYETLQFNRSQTICDLRRNVAKNDNDEARASRQEWSTKAEFTAYHFSSTRFVLDVIAKGCGNAIERARGRAKIEHSSKARHTGLDEWDDV